MNFTKRIYLFVSLLTLYFILREYLVYQAYEKLLIEYLPRKLRIILSYCYPVAEAIIHGLAIFQLIILIRDFLKERLAIGDFGSVTKKTSTKKNDLVKSSEPKDEDIGFNIDEFLTPKKESLIKLNLFVIACLSLFYLLYTMFAGENVPDERKMSFQQKIDKIRVLHSEPIYEQLDGLIKSSSTTSYRDYDNTTKKVKDFLDKNSNLNFEPIRITEPDELAKYLYVSRKMDLEKEFLSKWGGEKEYNQNYYDYLRNNYYNFYDYLLESKQFNRLRWYANNFLQRLYFNDTSFNYYHDDMDQMVLISILFSDKNLMKSNRSELPLIKGKINSVFAENSETAFLEYEKIDFQHKFFGEVSAYINGIVALRNRDFLKAYDVFQSVSKSTKNFYLLNYCELLKARCVFWDYDRDVKKITNSSQQAISTLEKLANNVKISSLKTDIYEYAQLILDFEEYREQEALDDIFKEDNI